MNKRESAKIARKYCKTPDYYVANLCRQTVAAKDCRQLYSRMTRARHGSYIFKRPGSENWYVKLRSPTGRVEKSLGTTDKLLAEELAGPMITDHKLRAARPRVETTWESQLPPGLHTCLNGERIYATPTELHFLDETPIRIEPNGVTALAGSAE